MSKKITKKITSGFVIQTYLGKSCESQEFVAGEVEYEDENDNPVDAPDGEEYCPFHMVQPDDMIETGKTQTYRFRNNQDDNDFFEVEAENEAEAMREALFVLNYNGPLVIEEMGG